MPKANSGIDARHQLGNDAPVLREQQSRRPGWRAVDDCALSDGVKAETASSAILWLSLALGLAVLPTGCAATSTTSREIDADSTAALQLLYAQSPVAADLDRRAKAILIFPDIVKGGFIVGGQHGEGLLRMDGKTIGYYNTVGGSFGLQGSKITEITPKPQPPAKFEPKIQLI